MTSLHKPQMHLLINALAASAGSGLTYVRNVVGHFAACDGIKTTFLLRPGLRDELADLPNVCYLPCQAPSGAARRFCYEQRVLPQLIRANEATVLISTGNFALRHSPVPQILLSGNSLYTSADFYRDLRKRGDYQLWLDTRIKGMFARKSVQWADTTVAPSVAFAQQLRNWAGGNVVAVPHGFDRDVFFGDDSPLSPAIQNQLSEAGDSLRLLFVSHYNYYRNFETLFRALPLLRQRLNGRKAKLLLTCTLRSEANPGSFQAGPAATLVRELGLEADVVELGAVPYRQLHHLYRACDIYATAAYAESFAHPLVEAMASGLPVVASDLAVHREVCGDAARYFARFSPEDLASSIAAIAASSEQARGMAQRGLQRSRDFSWSRHVTELITLAESLQGPASNHNEAHIADIC